jgi:hypothetical protein
LPAVSNSPAWVTNASVAPDGSPRNALITMAMLATEQALEVA